MRYSGLFEPDVLIGELSGAGRRHAATLSSEKRLLLAVLRNGLECYQQHLLSDDHIGREMFREAAAWIESTDRVQLFSFEAIAEALEIDAGYLRRLLADWKAQRLGALGHERATVQRGS